MEKEAFSLCMIKGVLEIENYHGNFNSYYCATMAIIKFKLLKSKEELLDKLEKHGNARL